MVDVVTLIGILGVTILVLLLHLGVSSIDKQLSELRMELHNDATDDDGDGRDDIVAGNE